MDNRCRAGVLVFILSPIGSLYLQAALGDEVVMSNGDRLTGTIVRETKQTILLKTAYLGIVEIDRSGVQSHSRRPMQASNRIEEPPHAEPDAVTNVPQSSDQQDIASEPENKASQSARTALAGPPPVTPKPEFSGRVNFALSDEKGNTDKSEIDFDYRLDYRQGWHRAHSFGALEFDTNHSEKTTDKWSTFNQYSRLLPSRWYGAAWFVLEHDRFAQIRLRTLGGPVLGYLAFESDALNLSMQAGPAPLYEDYYDQPDQNYWGMSWLLRYDQLVWQNRLQPYHRQFGYVALDGENKFLWQSWTGLRLPLAGGFSGSVEFEYDYDSNPAIQAKTTDTTVRLKLGYEW